jgi:hypothetical protein
MPYSTELSERWHSLCFAARVKSHFYKLSVLTHFCLQRSPQTFFDANPTGFAHAFVLGTLLWKTIRVEGLDSLCPLLIFRSSCHQSEICREGEERALQKVEAVVVVPEAFGKGGDTVYVSPQIYCTQFLVLLMLLYTLCCVQGIGLERVNLCCGISSGRFLFGHFVESLPIGICCVTFDQASRYVCIRDWESVWKNDISNNHL